MSEYVRVCQSMPEYARICQNMPEYARVCQSMPALDIEENGYFVANMPLEVGCRGVIDKRNALTLETICNLVGIKAQ